eukprot:m.287466 g.287466  ORF g.287466 m.287466 type:complete len:67 (+) comp170112_c0_seq1:3-203(+)
MLDVEKKDEVVEEANEGATKAKITATATAADGNEILIVVVAFACSIRKRWEKWKMEQQSTQRMKGT